MTSNGHWTHRLSEYLDDELAPLEREACGAHLDGCAECARTLEELRAVVTEAGQLPDQPPPRDLWAGIESRLQPRTEGADSDVVALTPRTRPGRVTLTVPQLMAAAIALVAFSASAVWVLVPEGAAGPAMAGGEVAEGSALGSAGAAGQPTLVAPVTFAVAYEQAISELELELEQRRALLDPETVRVVEANLAIIDEAITEANQALTRDPSSGFLQTHLANTMRQKVDLLRRVAAIEQKGS